ncbi:MAG TPA: CocE/NonD family hydrolase [Terriglobia bacterium]|nr:CocE/NonD family hydrolase [Terriglobia bacterium]
MVRGGALLALAVWLRATPAIAADVERQGNAGRDEPTRTSFYLTMRDGVRIAVDLNLPANLRPNDKIPALVRQTRYYRSFALGWTLRFATRNWPSQRKLFLSHGYAWLDVDVRGTGASFGQWTYPWSPDEIRDGAEVVDWVVRQPWSNGKVGAIGTSYDGGSAELLLLNHHPAVKAVAPEFTFFDAYSDLAFPGGIWLQSFSEAWQKLDRALDIDYVKSFTPLMPRIVRSSYHGVRPVDDDANRALLKQAIAGHDHNLDVARMAAAITYRDDAPWPPGLSLDAFSPFTSASEISRSGAAIYFVEGWFDASFPQAALSAFATLKNPVSLVIGPWGHGSLLGGGPAASRHSGLKPDDQLLRFFDFHLKHAGCFPVPPRSITYFTLVANKWTVVDQWPPPGIHPARFYLDRDQGLSPEAPRSGEASDVYHVDPTAASGFFSRWDLGSEIVYLDRRRADKTLLCYTSRPLDKDVEVTGTPGVKLFLKSTAADGEFFAYLEDVDRKGRVSYVTEGELRALHRAVSFDPPYPQPTPYHSFKRKDGFPMRPDEPSTIAFAMIPTSYLFRKGHAVRLVIAGADRDHFAPLPGPPPVWTVYRDASHASSLELPIRRLR